MPTKPDLPHGSIKSELDARIGYVTMTGSINMASRYNVGDIYIIVNSKPEIKLQQS